jgi:hypothetical protein
MWSRCAFRLLVLIFPAIVSGCGLFDFEEREPWRAQAEAACFARGLVTLTPLIQKANAIEGKGICGLDRPLKVAALADGSIQLGTRPVIMSCPMTAALESWVRDSVMPAAYERYGVPVVEIKSMGTYNCRTRNNIPGARLSEHAFANAFDFAGVVLANGYTVTVRKGWRGDEADRAFLRQVHAGACGPFTTVLGPGSDGLHEDHLHLDLARHDNAGTRRYCKPNPVMPAPGQFPPVYQPYPEDMPVASADPQMQGWPRVLPQSIEAADGSMLPPGTIETVPGDPAYGQAAVPQEVYSAPQPPGCPPGYICTPAAGLSEPPPVGWNVGPQPIQGGYSDITGSVGDYSDH